MYSLRVNSEDLSFICAMKDMIDDIISETPPNGETSIDLLSYNEFYEEDDLDA